MGSDSATVPLPCCKTPSFAVASVCSPAGSSAVSWPWLIRSCDATTGMPTKTACPGRSPADTHVIGGSAGPADGGPAALRLPPAVSSSNSSTGGIGGTERQAIVRAFSSMNHHDA